MASQGGRFKHNTAYWFLTSIQWFTCIFKHYLYILWSPSKCMHTGRRKCGDRRIMCLCYRVSQVFVTRNMRKITVCFELHITGTEPRTWDRNARCDLHEYDVLWWMCLPHRAKLAKSRIKQPTELRREAEYREGMSREETEDAGCYSVPMSSHVGAADVTTIGLQRSQFTYTECPKRKCQFIVIPITTVLSATIPQPKSLKHF
jgi:hypothetical protein